MLLSDKCVYLHIPKTGGILTKRAIMAATSPGTFTEYHEGNDWHPAIPPTSHRHLPRFCFVRNPFNWYESYWRFKKQHGVDNNNIFDTETRLATIPDFSTWIRTVYTLFPNYYTNLLKFYIQFENWKIIRNGFTSNGYFRSLYGYVGKQESLITGVRAALEWYEIPYSSDLLCSLDRQNVSAPIPTTWNEFSWNLVRINESEVFETFRYKTEVA